MAWNLGLLGASTSAAGAFELISTTVLTANTASVTFSSIPQDYKHLQIRYVARSTRASLKDDFDMIINSDTGANYALHLILGNGSSAGSFSGTNTNFAFLSGITGSTAAANNFGAGVTDLLDPFATTKNKTFKTLGGTSSEIQLTSSFRQNTAATTSILLRARDGNLVTGSRFSLYGIRG